MTKRLIICLALSFLFSTLAHAEPGVVVSAKGDVKIDKSGQIIMAVTGTKFEEGSTITTGTNSQATIMFSTGVIKKLTGDSQFTVGKLNNSTETGIIRGLAMAYNDSQNRTAGPTAHGMVKAGPMGMPPPPNGGNEIISAEIRQNMRRDLNEIKSIGLNRDGINLMRAQIFYKYGQYKKMVNTLTALYNKQTPPSETVKELLALGYEKLGNFEKARQFK